MIYHREKCHMSFGFGWPDQTTVKIYTVLSVGQHGDCAAYRGIGPDLSGQRAGQLPALLELIRSGGSKIREKEARELFPEIEEQKLEYRR